MISIESTHGTRARGTWLGDIAVGVVYAVATCLGWWVVATVMGEAPYLNAIFTVACVGFIAGRRHERWAAAAPSGRGGAGTVVIR